MAESLRHFQIEVLSSLRNGGVYHPDASQTGVLPPSTFPKGRGILTACPSTTPLGLVLGPD